MEKSVLRLRYSRWIVYCRRWGYDGGVTTRYLHLWTRSENRLAYSRLNSKDFRPWILILSRPSANNRRARLVLGKRLEYLCPGLLMVYGTEWGDKVRRGQALGTSARRQHYRQCGYEQYPTHRRNSIPRKNFKWSQIVRISGLQGKGEITPNIDPKVLFSAAAQA